jgi:hypothetical protein
LFGFPDCFRQEGQSLVFVILSGPELKGYIAFQEEKYTEYYYLARDRSSPCCNFFQGCLGDFLGLSFALLVKGKYLRVSGYGDRVTL